MFTTLLYVTIFVLAASDQVLANVTVTGASAGSSISADAAANAESPQWTTLGPITLAEGANTDFAGGNGLTLVLEAPGGFELNTAVTPDITFTPDRDILSASVAINNSTTITVTLDVSILFPLATVDTLTIGSTIGIQVRPTSGTPLATGKHIHRPTSDGGSASIAGITASPDGSGGSNFGDLTEIAGAAALIRVETLAGGDGTVLPPQNVTAGSSITGYAIIRDTFSNFVANGAADTWSLPSKSGGVVPGDLVPAVDMKSAVFTGHLTGMATIGVTSGGHAQSESGTQTVVAGSATSLFVTLPNETFTAGSGNSGTVVTQTTVVPFSITKLTAVDSFTNIATTYGGSQTVTYSGPGGTPTYTTNVDFTGGLSTTTLTTTLTLAETTSITANVSGLTGVPSSTLIVKPANQPPEIAPIASQTVYVDHPALYKFYIRDQETATNNLRLSFLSSNPSLFPTTNAVFHYFVFDADGQHWYLTLVPAFGQTGTATNTLTVSDGVNSTSANFVVTVNPPPPGAMRFANTNTISIPDVGAAGPYPSTNIVRGMNGMITNLTLTLSQINHQWIKDVHMLLVGPTGQAMVPFSRISSGPVGNTTATLTDASPFILPSAFELWSEQFRATDLAPTDTNNPVANHFPAPAPPGPYGPVSFSNSFNGLPANGAWYLYVYDDNGPSHGNIAGGWSLMIATDGTGVPTISDIPDQSTTVGTATAAIPFTIADPNAPAANLTLSASSSNPTLVPTNNIVFGGSASNRTMTATPAGGQTGTAAITVLVNSDTASASATFVLTVSLVNTPPTITSIADQAISEDTSTGAISFTIEDGEAAAVNLSLDKNSSDPALVPTNNIVFGGSGSNWTVMVTPLANQNGTATITVTVSDGQLSTSTNFLLTVNAVNDSPSISDIANQLTAQNIPTAAIPFTIEDVETPAASLTLTGDSSNPTLVPTNNIVFGGSGANRTVTVTPATGQSGTATITVTVSDGTTSASDSFLLTVGAANQPPEIATIASQTVYVDHPALYKFYIRDQETATNNLQLSFLSSNPALFPATNAVFHYFVFDADGQHWYLTLVPAFGQTGTATNTLTVSDGTNRTSADFVVTVNPPPAGAVRFANTNVITIPSAGTAIPYPSTNIVSGMSGTITGVTLTLSQINHQWIKDVHMLLVGPTGQAMVPFSRISSGPVGNTTATLTDASPFILPSAFELWSEQFRATDFAPADTNNPVANHFPSPAPPGPYGPVSFSNSFSGLPANGEWYLYVYDDTSPSQGNIVGGWSLMIATKPSLKILSLTGAGTTNVVITWSAVSNVTYRVQYQEELNPTNWSNLVPDIAATNTTASTADNPGAAGPRFYRVQTVP